MLEIKKRKLRRHTRVRAKISGVKNRPRLCVFVSNNHIYAQLINDQAASTLAFASDISLKGKKAAKAKLAFEVGKAIAQKGLEKNIEKVVFDRGGFKYHGVVKALADGARQGGLRF